MKKSITVSSAEFADFVGLLSKSSSDSELAEFIEKKNICNILDEDSKINILHLLTFYNKKDLVYLILKDHPEVDINQKSTDDSLAPLHIAAEKNHHEILNMLLEFGADTSIMLSEKFTAHDIALRNGSKECLEVLSKFHVSKGIISEDEIEHPKEEKITQGSDVKALEENSFVKNEHLADDKSENESKLVLPKQEKIQEEKNIPKNHYSEEPKGISSLDLSHNVNNPNINTNIFMKSENIKKDKNNSFSYFLSSSRYFIKFLKKEFNKSTITEVDEYVNIDYMFYEILFFISTKYKKDSKFFKNHKKTLKKIYKNKDIKDITPFIRKYICSDFNISIKKLNSIRLKRYSENYNRVYFLFFSLINFTFKNMKNFISFEIDINNDAISIRREFNSAKRELNVEKHIKKLSKTFPSRYNFVLTSLDKKDKNILDIKLSI